MQFVCFHNAPHKSTFCACFCSFFAVVLFGSLNGKMVKSLSKLKTEDNSKLWPQKFYFFFISKIL